MKMHIQSPMIGAKRPTAGSCLGAAALYLALTSLSASADVISLSPISFNSAAGSQTNYPSLSFAKFNGSLGTLTSVTFDWIVNSSVLSATVTNQSTGTVSINKFSFTRNFSMTGPGDVSIIDDLTGKTVSFSTVALATGQSKTVSNVAFNSINGSSVLSEGLDAFVGTGNASVSLFNAISVTPNVTAGGSQDLSWLSTISGASDGSLAVSYNYTPVQSVPEPSSALLCGVPALFGGFVLLRKRSIRGAAPDR